MQILMFVMEGQEIGYVYLYTKGLEDIDLGCHLLGIA